MDTISSIISNISSLAGLGHDLLNVFRDEIIAFSCLILFAGIFQNIIYFLQIPFAALELLSLQMREQEEHSWWLLTSNITMPITVLIPVYNEEKTIISTVSSALATQYPSLEVIVVNDGSIDLTLDKLKDYYSLTKKVRFFEPSLIHQPIKEIYGSSAYPNLIVVDKYNGGRSDALNAGIDISRTSIFCTLDGDSTLDPPALLKTIQPFIEKPFDMMAVGGTVRVINGCHYENGVVKKIELPKNPLLLFQVNEYIRAFLLGRLAWSHVRMVTVISGAFALFRRDIAIKVGGFSSTTIGEDFELVMKIHRHCREKKIPYDIKFIPEPVCWTVVPTNIKTLAHQRIRWQQGGLEVLHQNKRMFMNPRYGRIGLIVYPIAFIADVLGPILEVIGFIFIPLFYLLGALDLSFMIGFLCLFFVLGVFLSVISLALEELSLKRFRNPKDVFLLGLAAIFENFGYRQINNVWRMIGTWRFLINKQQWGHKSHLKLRSKD